MGRDTLEWHMNYRFDLVKSLANQCSDVEVEANERAARSLGLPDVSTLRRPRPPRLAIVGGGPSINSHVNALRNWRGGVWAINNAAAWCSDKGVACSMFTIDSSPAWFEPLRGKVLSAIVSMRAHPELFALLRDVRDVVTFDLPANELGPGSAASACIVGSRLCGYVEIVFFGCEGSFDMGGGQYAYDQVNRNAERLLLVSCAGERFLTSQALLFTTRSIAWTVRQFPGKVKERSGGLLGAMVKDFEWRLVGVSPALADSNTPRPLVEEYESFVRMQ
jgi:hypothetical protein